MKVWITRPQAYEVWMGGLRHVVAWLAEPSYSHQPHNHWKDGRMATEFRDFGWFAGSSDSPTAAKPLLKQDEQLLGQVWEWLLWSIAPKGTDRRAAIALWEDQVARLNDGRACHAGQDGSVAPGQGVYRDEDWEARCNLSHKRFLLEVDVRTNRCALRAPRVYCQDQPECIGTHRRTTLVPRFLALQTVHQNVEHLRLPF